MDGKKEMCIYLTVGVQMNSSIAFMNMSIVIYNKGTQFQLEIFFYCFSILA